MTGVSIIQDDVRAGCGTVPITPDKPAGEDARASPEFDAIDAEIRKLDTEGPNAVNWKMVAEAGLDFIALQSKDLLVGAWTTFALFRREGLPGLSVGLSILQGIIETYWPVAFPAVKRERARVAALEWLAGRLAPALAEKRYVDADAPQWVAIQDAIDRIDQDVSAKLTKESLNLVDCIRVIRPLAEQAKRFLQEAARQREDEAKRVAADAERALQPEVEATARPSQSDAAPADHAPAAATRTTGQNFDPADLDGLATMLWSTSRDLHRQNIGDPRAYVMGRTGSWFRFDALPPAQAGTTMVVAPLELDSIATAAGQGHLEEALFAAEDLIWTAPFCLDAHRVAYELLGTMDRGLDAARGAVLGLLIYFTKRHAGVTDLSFHDGRPFADAATQALIASASGAGASNGPADLMASAIREARGLMGKGEAHDALDLLSRTLWRATSGRQRAHWQVAQAGFCLEQGFVSAALPLLDHLDRLVEDQNLETWEPEFACAVAELRIRALTHGDTLMVLDEDRRRRALESTRGRLARLDIGAAVRMLRPN